LLEFLLIFSSFFNINLIKIYFLDPTFFDGRCAEIIYKNHSIGTFGVLHPEVINSFSLVNPCSAMEINIEEFL